MDVALEHALGMEPGVGVGDGGGGPEQLGTAGRTGRPGAGRGVEGVHALAPGGGEERPALRLAVREQPRGHPAVQKAQDPCLALEEVAHPILRPGAGDLDGGERTVAGAGEIDLGVDEDLDRFNDLELADRVAARIGALDRSGELRCRVQEQAGMHEALQHRECAVEGLAWVEQLEPAEPDDRVHDRRRLAELPQQPGGAGVDDAGRRPRAWPGQGVVPVAAGEPRAQVRRQGVDWHEHDIGRQDHGIAEAHVRKLPPDCG